MLENCTIKDPNCNGECAHCGWNPKEAAMRKDLFDTNGLTRCKDGLKRLIIKREG